MCDIYAYPITGEHYPNIIPAFIEVSKNTNVKYEWDNARGVMMLDRILHSSVVYPENYGFIPQTLCDDGDPLDILVMCNYPLQPGTMANVRPICYMDMSDEKGGDQKVLGVVEGDPNYAHIHTIADIGDHKLSEIKEFFSTYKNLEKNKWVTIDKWYDIEDTLQLVKDTHRAYI